MRRLLVLLVALAACSGTSQGTTTVEEFTLDTANLEPCPTEAGDVITETMAEEGCMDGDSITILGVHDCEDGRQLWAEGELWGWIGEPITESDGDAAGDSAYAEAFEECNP